jgi:hypothetical protein
MEASYIPVDIQLLQPEVESPSRFHILIGKHYVPHSQQGEGFTMGTRDKLLTEFLYTLCQAGDPGQAAGLNSRMRPEG